MSKTSETKKYTKELKKMFSDKDFARYFDVTNKILTYEDLEKYNTIKDLLPDEKDFKIILTQTKPNSGHWCCIVRNKNNIIWFDSYGVPPDGELKYISKEINHQLHQDIHQIHRLMNTAKADGLDANYNHHKYQSESDLVCTCGRWCVWAILMNNLNYSLEDCKNFINKWSYEKSKPPDILICDWII